MQEITGFGMKVCVSLPGLDWKNNNSLREEDDETIYTYNEKPLRWFSSKSILVGRVAAYN